MDIQKMPQHSQTQGQQNFTCIYVAFILVGGKRTDRNHTPLKSTQAVSNADTAVCLRLPHYVYLWLYEWILLQEHEESIQLSDGLL